MTSEAALKLREDAIEEIHEYLNSTEADYGLNDRTRQLITYLSKDDDEVYKIFSNILTGKSTTTAETTTPDGEASALMTITAENAARSYRAMTILKEDVTGGGSGGSSYYFQQQQPLIVTNPEQAGLLAKDLIAGLSNQYQHQQQQQRRRRHDDYDYSIVHIREVLDVLLDTYTEKVLGATASGSSGLQQQQQQQQQAAIQNHLEPFFLSPVTLPCLTNLVCYGCTGRKGIASSEKSAAQQQHTASSMYPQGNNGKNKISINQRKKFVRQMVEFQFMERMGQCLTGTTTSTTSSTGTYGAVGEEVCEAILTILEVIGYPPSEGGEDQIAATTTSSSRDHVMVGEDVLLSPLASTKWWKDMLQAIYDRRQQQQQQQQQQEQLQEEEEEEKLEETYRYQQQMESIARTLHCTFALAAGNSSRICKSRAPAMDATEQATTTRGTVEEGKEEEEEEKITNRLIEWGLTDKMYDALLGQLPLLLQTIHLPDNDVMNYQATTTDTTDTDKDTAAADKDTAAPVGSGVTAAPVRHPGRYRTVPIGSWRLQLLGLLKEIICYRRNGDGSNNTNANNNNNNAMDVIMGLPLSPELQKKSSKKQQQQQQQQQKESQDDEQVVAAAAAEGKENPLYNPWPALCSFVFAYPYNDFYHNIFFQMIQAVVMEHHEPTLRVILQKSKFLTRALRCMVTTSTDSNNNNNNINGGGGGSSSTGNNSNPPPGALNGLVIRILNLLRLRSQSLPPNAFLTQYLSSHDLWKVDVPELIEVTIRQETPIRADPMKTGTKALDGNDIDLGSPYATKLGFGGITKWDGTATTTTTTAAAEEAIDLSASQGGSGGNKKKKKNNNKKKKKKK